MSNGIRREILDGCDWCGTVPHRGARDLWYDDETGDSICDDCSTKQAEQEIAESLNEPITITLTRQDAERLREIVDDLMADRRWWVTKSLQGPGEPKISQARELAEDEDYLRSRIFAPINGALLRADGTI